MARPNRKNPWTSMSEILLWILVVALIFPAAFAGYAVGHYTSLGKPPATVTTTIGSPTTPATTTSASTTTSSSGGNAAAGKTLFTSDCATCHTFAAAGANGTFGPNLDKVLVQDAQADHSMALDAFIRESIVNPNAYIATGFTKPSGMPSNFGQSLTKTQIDDLVAFIVSGTQQ